MIDETLKKIREHIYSDFKSEKTGHDIEHLDKVTSYARIIQTREGGDAYVVLVAALVHDVHRLMSKSTKIEMPVSPAESLPKVEEILRDCGVLSHKIPAILEVVEKHDEKMNGKNFSLETKIIQDADILDALGEDGLRRTLKFCAYKNIPISDTSVPLSAEEYVPEANPISACHYIYRTQIPWQSSLHTQTAKELAKDRIKVMADFVEQNYQ